MQEKTLIDIWIVRINVYLCNAICIKGVKGYFTTELLTYTVNSRTKSRTLLNDLCNCVVYSILLYYEGLEGLPINE